jgi:hypothetical protein
MAKVAKKSAGKQSASKKPAPSKKPARKPRIDGHRDGSIRAKGATRDGELDGYWEWFRLDGTPRGPHAPGYNCNLCTLGAVRDAKRTNIKR